MTKIAFFGLGAVGSVMATALYELFTNNNEQVHFIFFARDIEKAKNYLFRAPHIQRASEFIELEDFNEVLNSSKAHSEHFADLNIVINAASPMFNELLLKLAIRYDANYCDLASDMYNDETLSSLKFPQYKFDKEFKAKNSFALINIGVSPGVTNFMIGEKLYMVSKTPGYGEVKSVNLYLLEHIESDQIVFSWSPKVALDELEQHPKYFEESTLVSVEPFSHKRTYEFPHLQRAVSQYPLYQEEVLAIHKAFPEIKNIRVFTGGSEVELIKNLYQLNLLSKTRVGNSKNGSTVEEIVRDVLPSLVAPQRIEEMLKSKVISYAHFSAMAEMKIERVDSQGRVKQIAEVVGLSFDSYSDLLGTSYSGATYISYPTGVGAAVLLYYSCRLNREEKGRLIGVLGAEELPEKMGSMLVDEVKRELSGFNIDLVTHTHLV